MKHFLLCALCAAMLPSVACAQPVDDYRDKNDSVLLKNGQQLVGRILADTRDAVVMMLDSSHVSIPRHDIERIYNKPERDIAFSRLLPGAGHFPPWWVPSYDLFYSDWVRKFEQVPAFAIEEGIFARVPYLSFRANGWFEINIYGDPKHPAGIEAGIYGWRKGSAKYQALAREFMTSYMHSIPEIRAMEELPSSGGLAEIDGMSIEITPPDAPDAYDAWWVSMWYPAMIEKARVSSSEFKEKTASLDEVVSRTVSATRWDKRDLRRMQRKLARQASPLVYETNP